MRLPKTAHTSRPWRIHELTRDLRLEDVWKLPTPGGPDDFPRLVDLVTSSDPSHGSSGIVRVLFAVRWKIGSLFGWDDSDPANSSPQPLIRDRLPDDLRHGATGPAFGTLPFAPLYRTDTEMAAEIVNRTVHGVLHLGWVPDDTGGYHGQMAVYVKRNGILGAAYMAAINPFRYLIVYPLLMRNIEKRWAQ